MLTVVQDYLSFLSTRRVEIAIDDIISYYSVPYFCRRTGLSIYVSVKILQDGSLKKAGRFYPLSNVQ